jgi:hypothetical protein
MKYLRFEYTRMELKLGRDGNDSLEIVGKIKELRLIPQLGG